MDEEVFEEEFSDNSDDEGDYSEDNISSNELNAS